jgi:hypothetical protein
MIFYECDNKYYVMMIHGCTFSSTQPIPIEITKERYEYGIRQQKEDQQIDRLGKTIANEINRNRRYSFDESKQYDNDNFMQGLIIGSLF